MYENRRIHFVSGLQTDTIVVKLPRVLLVLQVVSIAAKTCKSRPSPL